MACKVPGLCKAALVIASVVPHWLVRLTNDALQAALLSGCAGYLLSAGLLTTDSAAPHCPFRLTDDALQAVVPDWSAVTRLSM